MEKFSKKQPGRTPTKDTHERPGESVSISLRLSKTELNLLDKRAEAIDLSRSEYIRKLLAYSIRYLLSPEDYDDFCRRAKRINLPEYTYANFILTRFLRGGLGDVVWQERAAWHDKWKLPGD